MKDNLDFDITYLEKNNKPHAICKSISTELVSSDELKDLMDQATNHYSVYRHVHMEAPAQGPMLGQVEKAWIEKDKDGVNDIGMLDVKLFNQTPYQKKIVEYIKLKNEVDDPVQMSACFIRNPEGDVHPVEFSFTRIPVYKGSEVNIKMENDKKNRIKELENELDQIKNRNDALNEKLKLEIEKYENLSEKFETVKVKYEDEMDKEKNSLKKTMLKKFEEFQEKVDNQLKETKEHYEEKLARAIRKPIIDELIKYEEKDEQVVTKLYPLLNEKELKERLEKKKIEARRNGNTIQVTGTNHEDPDLIDEEVKLEKKEMLKEIENYFGEYEKNLKPGGLIR